MPSSIRPFAHRRRRVIPIRIDWSVFQGSGKTVRARENPPSKNLDARSGSIGTEKTLAGFRIGFRKGFV
jgi:hypothetical protein